MENTQPGFARGQKICRPADWIDVIKFFALNFGLHALTAISLPGSTVSTTIHRSLLAILQPFPIVLFDAIPVICRMAALAKSDLEMAFRSEALCMIVPTALLDLNGKPRVGRRPPQSLPAPILGSTGSLHQADETQRPESLEALSSSAVSVAPSAPRGGEHGQVGPYKMLQLRRIQASTTTIHGQYPTHVPPQGAPETLNPAWTLVTVPASFRVRPLLGSATPERRSLWQRAYDLSMLGGECTESPLRLSSNYSLVKTIAAIIQIIYGSWELYMVSDVQIDRYGYAAYEFTVIPYIIMSLINLVATLCAPSYQAMYIVHYRGMVDPEEVLQEEDVKAAASSRSDLENGNVSTLSPADEIRTTAAGEAVAKQIVSDEAGDGKEGEGVYPEYWWDERQRRVIEAKVGCAVGYAYGSFELPDNSDEPRQDLTFLVLWKTWRRAGLLPKYVVCALLLCFFVAPYIIISALTHWQPGDSTPLQCRLVILWIVNSQIGMVVVMAPLEFIRLMAMRKRDNKNVMVMVGVAAMVGGVGLFGIPIVGAHAVAKMILEGVVCFRF